MLPCPFPTTITITSQAPPLNNNDNKHLGCPHCKKFGAILEMDDGRTPTNRPEDKKAIDDEEGFTPER